MILNGSRSKTFLSPYLTLNPPLRPLPYTRLIYSLLLPPLTFLVASIERFSIVTLVLFFVGTFFVIQPVKIPIHIPKLGRYRIPIDLNTAPILTIAILWASQCLGPTEIRHGIVGTNGIKPYSILILFISLAYMAITLDITGIVQAAAFWVSNRGGNNGRKLYLYFYVMLTLISMVIGNEPVILSGTVFLAYYTAAMHLEPLAWLMSEFAAANTASMVLFVGNPTNVVICEGFAINNVGFTGYTILPFIACNALCFVTLAIQFRDPKYVPRKLNITGSFNVREVLRDPIGAVVGTVTLISCLIVALIVSFLHTDVWKIMLPFAGFKFLFDMCWDHFRFTRGNFSKNSAEDEEAAMRHEIQLATAEAEQSELNETTQDDHADRQSTLVPDAPPRFTERNITENGVQTGTPTSPSLFESKGISEASIEPEPCAAQCTYFENHYRQLAAHFPTFFTALPRLPFALIPFAFSQFILIETLTCQGWIDVFGRWLVIASAGKMHATIWLVGVMGVILCNIAGTNIGATIFLTKIIHQANLDAPTQRGAAIALAVASNIGAVNFTFSAGLAGLLWKTILLQKGIRIKQWHFAKWNMLPLIVMTAIGLAVVSAEMAVLY